MRRNLPLCALVAPSIMVLTTLLAAAPADAKSPPRPPVVVVAAHSFDAQFSVNGVDTEADAVDDVVAAAGGNSSVSKINNYSTSASNTILTTGSEPVPQLSMAGEHTVSQAQATSSSSLQSAVANSTVGSIMVTLGVLPEGAPALIISATDVTSTSNFSKAGPGSNVASGSAGVGSLTVSGPLLVNAPGNTVSFSGSPAPNTVIYQDPNVTITINDQEIHERVTCSDGSCTAVPHHILTRAVVVTLSNSTLLGEPASGEIAIGSTTAY